MKDICRATRRHFSAEDKIRIVLDGLRREDSIAELCRKEGIAQSLCYIWSKEFKEAGKRRLTGDTARATTTDEVKDLRREAPKSDDPSVLIEPALELFMKCRNAEDAAQVCAVVPGPILLEAVEFMVTRNTYPHPVMDYVLRTYTAPLRRALGGFAFRNACQRFRVIVD